MTGEQLYWFCAIVVQPIFMWFLVGYWQRARTPSWERPGRHRRRSRG